MSWFRRSRRGLDDAQRRAIPSILGPLDRLGDGERDHHAALTAGLLDRPDWTPARGFEVTEDMRLTIAATAALLGVGTPDREVFGGVRAIVVHPTTMVDRRPRPTPMRGVVTEAPRSMAGHTSAHGPVFVSWRAVERDRRVGRSNVVLHEFAHKLDAATQVMDGTPLLDDATLSAWVDVCTRVHARLRSGPPDRVLRRYGATNPTEFFAVATEAFFTRPLDLQYVHPELYAVFAAGFGQDPAAVDAARGHVSALRQDDEDVAVTDASGEGSASPTDGDESPH